MTDLPTALRDKLRGSSDEAAVLAFAGAADVILEDNEMPFFPAYTDHGPEHIRRVLETCIRLTDPDDWRALVTSKDAAALVISSYLHDFAMHMREAGFVELIQASNRPLPWFNAPDLEGRCDMEWPVLWRSFQQEAQRLSEPQLLQLLGSEFGSQVPRVAFSEALVPSEWTTPDRLLIGEFLRRHHARIAHEVAVYGFPGLSVDDLPIVDSPLWNAAGHIARSHHMSIRSAWSYFEHYHPGSLEPGGVHACLVMALLRVADYLQLDADRAPPVLARLKDLQSPVSVAEWEKHRAVSHISWDTTNPHAIDIQISPSHRLATHLQLQALLRDLQREMDESNALLNEVHEQVQLSRRRIQSNLHNPHFVQSLPYIAEASRLRTAPDMFRLVVGELYGDAPSVAIRELLQNATDAVVKRESLHGGAEGVEFQAVEHDIEIETVEADDGPLLAVRDRGIGMDARTVIDSFLTAGVSTSADHSQVLTAGRFGVGVFASFLAGHTVRLTTRAYPDGEPLRVEFSFDTELAEVSRLQGNIPFGTEVQISLASALRGRLPEFAESAETWIAQSSPTVSVNGSVPNLAVDCSRDQLSGAPWVQVAGLKDLEMWWQPLPATSPDWSYDKRDFIHNGIKIASPPGHRGNHGHGWHLSDAARLWLATPVVCVSDVRGSVPLPLSRFSVGEIEAIEAPVLTSMAEEYFRLWKSSAPLPPSGKNGGLLPVLCGGEKTWTPLTPATIRDLTGLEVVWVVDPHSEKEFANRVMAIAKPEKPSGRGYAVVRIRSRRDNDPSQWVREFERPFARAFGLSARNKYVKGKPTQESLDLFDTDIDVAELLADPSQIVGVTTFAADPVHRSDYFTERWIELGRNDGEP